MIDYKSYWNLKGDYGRIRVDRMLIRKAKRKHKKGSHTCCPKCGIETYSYVGYVVNPYYADMYGEIRKERMCRDCYNDIAGDI